MRKSPYLLAIVIVIAAIGIGISNYFKTQSGPGLTNTNTIKIGGMSIANRGAAAFGTLGAPPVTAVQTPASTGTAELKADASTSRSSLIAPAPDQNVRYEYTGETITLPALPVLKRIKGFEGTDVQGIVKSVNAPLANLGSFTNLGLQQLTFAENKDNGYTVTLDALAGTASIYQNWERWATLQKGVPETAANKTIADLPADSDLITIAGAFLTGHGIQLGGYGTPVVRKDWIMSGIAELAYVPTEVSIVYPLLMDGKPVFDGSGQAYGITVGINLATKLVTTVSNITSLRFEASTYPMVDKTETVLEVVRRGGVYGNGTSTDAKAPVVEVGTPTVGYVFSSYQLDGGTSDVLVPALLFPLTKVPTGAPVYSQYIVVPLVRELLEQQIIQPLTTGGSTGSSSGVEVDTKPSQ